MRTGYRLVLLAILAIRPRLCSVHIQSLNHNPTSDGIFFQTNSKLSAEGATTTTGFDPPVGRQSRPNGRGWPMNEPAAREGARGEGQVKSGLLRVG